MKLRTHAKRLAYSLLSLAVSVELLILTVQQYPEICKGLFFWVYGSAIMVSFESWVVLYYLLFKEPTEAER